MGRRGRVDGEVKWLVVSFYLIHYCEKEMSAAESRRKDWRFEEKQRGEHRIAIGGDLEEI